MRILIINTDYPSFLKDLYARHPDLAHDSYATQMSVRNDSLFGVFDAYSRGFRANGHEAIEVHANNGLMQRQWMREVGEPEPRGARKLSRLVSLAQRVGRRMGLGTIVPNHSLRSPFDVEPWNVADMLVAQVKAYKPDVILNQSVSEVGSELLQGLRPFTQLIVGQIASPLPEIETYGAYDLMVSSLPNFVDFYQSIGVKAQLNRLGFDPRTLELLGKPARDVDVSFVGSISPAHPDRAALLERLAVETPIQVWGNGVETLPENSSVRGRYRGEAWGRNMFNVLARSRITVNKHIGIAEQYANNMRLYEATGMGALLITDRQVNLADMFEPGKEVVCYSDAKECVELIDYYSRNEAQRAQIAAAGQARTLKDHSYLIRTSELAVAFQRLLSENQHYARA